MAMVEHRHELEAKTKPILDTLRSYQDLPPVLILQESFNDQFTELIFNNALLLHIYVKPGIVCVGEFGNW